MKKLGALLVAATVGSCMATPPNPAIAAREQAQLAQLTAGKVPGAPMSCLPSYLANDMIVIDDNTLAFRNGPGQVYINHMRGGCVNIDRGGNTLVTRPVGSGSCSGDIARVVDLHAGITVGSCVFGEFVPYRRVR